MAETLRTSRERWPQIEQLYGQALERDGDDRVALLDHACANDPALRHEVETLLACEPRAGQFIEAPALEIAADVLRRQADFDLVGRQIGPYLVQAWLGSGGMGDVYRARDGHLHREVALKVLPDVFALDPDRLGRFTREAQVLASLNHPNIAAIYGFEESDGVRALALELVEGPTLADRIAQGPIPVDEALPIARQIAEGLEAAHEQGIVHRDLKPANIALRPDGTVKVLDFGLAKVLQRDASAGGEVIPSGTPAGSPDVPTPPPVQRGLMLGTAAYLSPEIVKGRQADKRSDIWAFGAALYEMLSGQRAFKGGSTSEILVSVVQQEIDWTALPPATPEPVRRLLARCLNRDVRRRLRDIGEARIVLDDPQAHAAGGLAAATERRSPQSTLMRRGIPLLLALIVIATVAALYAWNLKRPPPTLTVARFALTLPQGQVFSRGIGRHSVAISPDGALIVYSGVPAGLYLRPLSQSGATAIQGTEGYARVTEPVFSPDGRSVAFYTDRALKTISIAGGSAATVVPADAPYGINWGRDGIVFGQGSKGIMRVSPGGAGLQVLVRVKENEQAHGPQLLPDGQHVMFTLATGTATDRWDDARIVVESLASGKRVTLIEGGSDARYVTTGHIVYARSGVLFAVPFDVRRLQVEGAAVPIVEGVSRATGNQTGAAHFSVSETGSLVYIPGSSVASSGLGETMHLGLIDRKGRVKPLPLPPGAYQTPRVSPDGTRIAFGTDDGKEAIVWIYDLSAGTPRRRLTFGGNNRFPVWSADGQRVAFQSDRHGDRAVFWQPADGTGTAERLTTAVDGTSHVPESWSPRGDRFLYCIDKGSDAALWMFSLRDQESTPFGAVHSTTPIGAAFSPDGRWVAYASAEEDKQTIYVQPFPTTGAIYQLVAKELDIPSHPVWSPDGKELFYNPRPLGLEVVSISTTPTFAFGNSVAVSRPFQLTPPEQRRAYDVTPGGEFVARVSAPGAEYGTPVPRLEVVLNWFEELRARVPGTR